MANNGTGATSLTAISTVTCDAGGNGTGSDIVAVAGGNTTSLTVTAVGDVDGGLDGIRTSNLGGGALTVTVNGAVTGGSGAGIHNTANSQGGYFQIATSGSIDATSGIAFNGKADGTNGSANSTQVMNGGLYGDALMGLGSDVLEINSTAVLSAGIELNGGDDVGTGDGMIDNLNFNSWSGDFLGSNLQHWEYINLLGSSTLAIQGALTTLELTIDGGATLDATNSLNITGSLTNYGVVTMEDGTTGDLLAVSGDYTGGGALNIDVNFGTGKRDAPEDCWQRVGYGHHYQHQRRRHRRQRRGYPGG